VPPEPEVALFWSVMLPVMVGLVICGVTVSVPPDTQ